MVRENEDQTYRVWHGLREVFEGRLEGQRREAGAVGGVACHCARRRDGDPEFRYVLRDRAGWRLSRWRFVQTLADALEEQGPGDGGVAQHLGVPAAILRRDKFAPGYALLEGAAAQAPPMGRLRAEPHPVMKPHLRKIQVQSSLQQIQVGRHLLGPVAGTPPPTVKIPSFGAVRAFWA